MLKSDETKRHLLLIAKEEFLEKEFNNASVRNVAKKAGLTTGAIFRYYKTKEELFNALVAPAADTLIEHFKEAQKAHNDLISEQKTDRSIELSTDYLNQFIRYIYSNYDAFKLIICSSEGTKYDSYIHDLVELEVSQSELYFEKLRKLEKLEGKVSHELLYMITSAYFTAVFETIKMNMNEERAIEYVNELASFFNHGWMGLLNFK